METGNSNLSVVSKIVQMLIKLSFIPVHTDQRNNKVTLILCSTKTITCFIIYGGILLIPYVIIQLVTLQHFDAVILVTEKLNIIDVISSSILGLLISTLFPFCPVLFTTGIPSIPGLALARDLPWPKYGTQHILSFSLCLCGALISAVSSLLMFLQEEIVPAHVAITFNICSAVIQLFALLYWIVPIILLSACVGKFISICENMEERNKVQQARHCRDLYRDVDAGFGSFFLFVFSADIFLLYYHYKLHWITL